MDLPIPDSWPEAARHLLPVLRGPTSPANAWEAALDNAEAVLVREPLTPFLDVVVVLDLPELRLFVNQGHLDRWEATPEAALGAARENLPPATGLAPWEIDGVWTLDARDGYASSRLALPGWLAAFRDRVRGEPVAVIPDADTILVGGTDGGLPTEALVTEAFNRFHAAGTPVSPGPVTIDDNGRLIAWNPPLDHPLVPRVQACHRYGAGYEYRRQQDPFAQWLVDHDVPDLLAPYSLLRHPSGRVVSFACWPGGPALLPRADLVVLGPPGRLDGAPAVPWQAMIAAGHIGEPEPTLSPPRYRVTGAPDPGSLPAVDPRSYQPH